MVVMGCCIGVGGGRAREALGVRREGNGKRAGWIGWHLVL